MKQQIYTLKSLKELFNIAKDKELLGSFPGDVLIFFHLLEFGELQKDQKLEVVIVKRKNGKFVK